MNDIIKFSDVEKRVITLRGQKVLLDSDVAALYDVETKRVNEAVKNNQDKFPKGYFFELCEEELNLLRSKFSTTKVSPMSRSIPKAFTEKELYMLATILKSNRATRTTIAIVETFTKFRELTTTVGALTSCNDEKSQKSLMQKSSRIFSDLIGDEMMTTDTETEIELNLAVLKVKHTIKRKDKQK